MYIIFCPRNSFRYQLEIKFNSQSQSGIEQGKSKYPQASIKLIQGSAKVMWPLIRVLILGVIIINGGHARKVEWADADTIIVEATREDDTGNKGLFQRNDVPFFYHSPISILPERRRQGDRVKRSRSGRAFVHTCYSLLGDQGTCKTFNECFPMLYYTEGEHKGQIKHPVLADLLMSTSGPCQPPPLSLLFRDDFVPYQEEEEMQQAVLDLDQINSKDLICCPSSKSTPFPPTGEFKPRPTQIIPATERVSMRTTPSTSTTTSKPYIVSGQSVNGVGAPDAFAGFGSGGAQTFVSGDAAVSSVKTPSITTKPNPAVGQWGHRIPTRSTTPLPTLPSAQHENDISESESDESEEEKKVSAVKLPFPSSGATIVKFPPIKATSGDVSAPSNAVKLTFPPPSGSASPSTEKTNAADVSVPIQPVPTFSRPTGRPYKRPYVPVPDSNTSDVYVPVMAVGSLTPEDSVVVHNPTSVPLPVPTAEKEKETPKPPKPIYPDASPSFPFQATEVQLTGSSASKPELQATHRPIEPEGIVTHGDNISLIDLHPTPEIPPISGTDLTETPASSELPLPEATIVITEVPTTTTTTTTTTTERPKLPLIMDKAPCGRLNSSSDPKYPWVAAIKLGPKFICAGSLIDEYHVLTSAACVSHLSTLDIGKLRVYLGERILNSNIDGPTIVRKVLRAMRHRGFSITTLRNDIALLKMSLPIPIGTKRVKPVCLPLDEDRNLFLETSSEATIVGWGSNWNQIQNDVTHESNLTVWSKDACLDKYRYFIPETHFDDDDMLCAQYSTEQDKPKSLGSPFTHEVETDGSPLIVKAKNGIYQQIGISSWKLGSLSTFPRVLTRVSAYRHWIEKNRLRP